VRLSGEEKSRLVLSIKESPFHNSLCLVSYVVMTMRAPQHFPHRLPFAEVVTSHQSTVYGYLLRFTRHVPDAQDLFQETFLRAHRTYAALPPDVDVRAWLMRIAINLSKNYVRDRQRRQRVLVEEKHDGAGRETVGEKSMDTEHVIMSRETAQTLLTVIDTLPFHQRVAVIQRQFEGLDYSTIAGNLQCSPESARAHVYQALRKLRRALTADGIQPTLPSHQSE
jgi:RNA polymerase sigma-70 factor (ECF subfamily)